MSDISDLRLEVRKRRSAVTGKERRIFNNTGVDLKNTKEDPRRDPSVIKRYNSRQLNDYLNKLNKFMNRSNGYVPDSSGSFIRKADWINYKRAERKYNKIVKAHFEGIADILDPSRNVTIRDAEKLFVPDFKRAQGDIKHRPYNEIDRKPTNVKSAAALKKLQKQVESKSDGSYNAGAIKAGRHQANQMLDNAGLSGLKKVTAKLSSQQFDVLWNYWGFAGRLSQIGSSGGHKSKNIKDKFDPLDAQEKDNIGRDVKEMINAAALLKFEKVAKSIRKSPQYYAKDKDTAIRKAYDKIVKPNESE